MHNAALQGSDCLASAPYPTLTETPSITAWPCRCARFLGIGCRDEPRNDAAPTFAGLCCRIVRKLYAMLLRDCAKHPQHGCLNTRIRIRNDEFTPRNSRFARWRKKSFSKLLAPDAPIAMPSTSRRLSPLHANINDLTGLVGLP